MKQSSLEKVDKIDKEIQADSYVRQKQRCIVARVFWGNSEYGKRTQ